MPSPVATGTSQSQKLRSGALPPPDRKNAEQIMPGQKYNVRTGRIMHQQSGGKTEERGGDTDIVTLAHSGQVEPQRKNHKKYRELGT